MKKIVPILIVALLSSAITLIGYKMFEEDKKVIIEREFPEYSKSTALTKLDSSMDLRDFNFNYAAETTVDKVVHITSMSRMRSHSRNHDMPDFFWDFFGERYQQPREHIRQGSGSGVVISDDGYIVTNNHVVANADELEVTMHDKKTYRAELVGADPSTDIALLKIDTDDEYLDYINFANSDKVGIGDWVLAVGNPFNLSSTVTAGIISAKARNINILKSKYPIESFLQTDAAVNPGNSGGALVNLRGELIGINTAIATPTGTYAGYSFAVPSNLVAKVVSDLKNYGVVQRAFLGVMIRDMNSDLADELDVDRTEGVYIDSLLTGSAAEDAGIRKGDIILAIDDTPIKTVPELLEKIASHRPGDRVTVKLLRNSRELQIPVVLKNQEGSVEIVKKEKSSMLEELGVEVKKVEDKKILNKYDIEGGVEIEKILEGKISKQTNMREGFIITKVNNKEVKSVDDFLQALEDAEGGAMLEGVYPDYYGKYYYAFGL
jgi:serine protease Do